MRLSHVFLPALRAAPLPNGMTSLSETYGDWIVACQMQNDTPRCQMTQTEPKTQQLFMAMEMRRNADGATAATLLMPFGIALKNGVTLQTAKLLNISAVAAAEAKPFTAKVSLNGFAAAGQPPTEAYMPDVRNSVGLTP